MFTDKKPLKAGLALLAITSALTLTHAGTTRAQSTSQAQSAAPTLTAIVARLTADEDKIASLQSTVSSQAVTIQSLQNQKVVASTVTTTTTYGPFTVTGNDVYLTGYNLHIQSGSGTTYGTINGKGNLIIGYNESRGAGQDVRTGSHNLILGTRNNFSGYGGLVAGAQNGITGGYTTITGGYGNRALGTYSSVSGGQGLTATAAYDLEPEAPAVTNLQTQVTGLQGTQTSQGVTLSSLQSTVAQQGTITGLFSRSTDATRTDGLTNTELTLSGVNLHVVSGSGYTDDGTAGETTNTTLYGLGNLILGYNLPGVRAAPGDVRTGSHNLVVGDSANYSSYGGIVAGLYGTISAPYATVTGGSGNTASGPYSSVSGGQNNAASADHASVGGGINNTASGFYSSVSGGYSNKASGSASSVSGGGQNTAGGNNVNISVDVTSISGGINLSETTQGSWAAGSYHTP